MAGSREICLQPGMISRHGLITGATGTGKTVSLQTLAETFSDMGIAVFMADVKGDLSGVSAPADMSAKGAQRVRDLKLEDIGYAPHGCPACYWDVFGKKGIPLRTTISDMGPLLLARLLELNDVQSGVLQIIFSIADDNGLLLLDLKDLRSMVLHVGEERESYRAKYGQISPATIGAIQRALLSLESAGGENFFGEPALDVMDLLRSENGKGVINILEAVELVNSPRLYSCVLLWLLSEFYERLPEAGDAAMPKLAFFLDEAHLLFEGIPPVLLQKIEQVVRLIRSRGAGIFFVSQNPADIPDAILGQLGNRIQHALRAFTPRDQKAVRAAASAFRPNPDFNTAEVIGNLAVGEALVSLLDSNGTPEVVERAKVVPPQSHIGPVTDATRAEILGKSPLAPKYAHSVDRESAYEILSARADALLAQKEAEKRAREAEKAVKSQQRKKTAKTGAIASGKPITDIGDLLNSVARQAGNSAGREIGRTIIRGIMGSLFGGKG